MIRDGFNESVIKKVCWGNINTPMFNTYAHLTNADIEREIAEHAGIEQKAAKKKSDALEPKQCIKCYTVNPPTHNFCSTCGAVLDQDTEEMMETIEKEIEQDLMMKRAYEIALRALKESGM